MSEEGKRVSGVHLSGVGVQLVKLRIAQGEDRVGELHSSVR